MDNREAVNWLINISADIGKAEHSDLWHYEQALTEIKDMLESAQPVATDTNVGNTISRQAAIDALDEIESEIADGDGYQYEKWRKYFCELPSAQPERTCVNCGRTANNGGWYADGRTRCPIEEHYALPKDGYCHLWEKRNVTNDDYPERREA